MRVALSFADDVEPFGDSPGATAVAATLEALPVHPRLALFVDEVVVAAGVDQHRVTPLAPQKRRLLPNCKTKQTHMMKSLIICVFLVCEERRQRSIAE